MKKQIRRNIFESNSSSTHTLTICSEREFNAWKNGEILFDRWSEKFVKSESLTESEKEDAKDLYNERKSMFHIDWDNLNEHQKEKWYSKYAKENLIDNENCQSYDEYMDDPDLEVFVETYTTEHSDKIVAFGKFGYN